MRWRFPAALIALLLAAGPAAADVLCRTKGGGVFVRAACKKRETPIPIPAGPRGDAGAAPHPARLVDSAGRQVGLFVEAGREDFGSTVVFEVGTQLVSYGVGTQGIRGESQFYHLVADCSDPRVVVQPREAFIRQGTVFGQTAYYAGDPITTQSLVAYEHEQSGGACGGGELTMPNGNCCATSAGTTDVGPATVAFELSDFTPPFRLEP